MKTCLAGYQPVISIGITLSQIQTDEKDIISC